jgi:hypothetical protein
MLLLIQYTLIFASVLVLVALGGCFSEHSGVINIGLEGIMVMGALGGALMMKFLPAGTPALVMILLVILAAVAIGMLFSLLLGVAAIRFNADQTLVGTALNLLGPAAAVVLVRAINMAESTDNVSSTVMYGQAKKAFLMNIGKFEFNWFMLIALLVLIASYIVLYKTKFGLRRASPGGGLRGHQRLQDALRGRADFRRFGRPGRTGLHHRRRQRVEIRERRGGLRLPGSGGHDLRAVEAGEYWPGGPAVRPVPGAEQRVYRHRSAGCPESAQHRI